MLSTADVLVIADDPLLSEELVAALRDGGFRTAVREQLQNASEYELVVVADPSGPGRAPEVLRVAREHVLPPEVVALIPHGSAAVALELLRAGCADCLTGPLNPEALVESLTRALQRKRWRDEAELQRAANGLFAARTLDELVAVLVREGARLFGADEASLILSSADGSLRCHRPGVNGLTISADGVAARVLERNAPALLDGPASAHPGFEGIFDNARVRSSLVCPITGDGVRFGVFALNRLGDRPFRPAALSRAQALAAPLARAIEHLQRHNRSENLERLAAMGELIAGVAHEINSPVAYALSNAAYIREHVQKLSRFVARLRSVPELEFVDRAWKELYGEDELDDLVQATADCEEGLGRVAQLVRDMKMLSRRGSPGFLDLVSVVEAVRAATRVAATELRSCEVQIDVSEALVVRADPGQLSQIFINLLVNAAQAMEEARSPRRLIRVLGTPGAGGEVAVEVTDSGPGIPPQVRSRLFEPFFTTKPPGKGTGLGLSLARQIVERFGGKLEVGDGQPGATFRITFPSPDLAIQDEEEERDESA
ncbi:MAG: GAF domain-containing protein [Myxococcaceae bacterium]|nr:GAF domain-containing protein [Myxococcaceae bacterium]